MFKKLICILASALTYGSAFALLPPEPTPTIQIPREEIQQFVTAIAVIKHYYIKDVSDQKLFSYAIEGMLLHLDPHSSYLDKEEMKNLQATVSGKFVGIGIELTIQDGILKVISPLEDTPAFKAGIKPNDLIIKVDNKLVSNMTLQEAIDNIKGKQGSFVTLTIIRKGTDKPLIKDVQRDEIKVVSVKDKLLENNFGYVRLSLFQGPVANNLRKAIEEMQKNSGGMKGFILDLRNNPGGLLQSSADVVNTFLDPNKLNNKYNDVVVYTKGRIPGGDVAFKANGSDKLKGVPMIVLINGGSASASEIVAGALQDYKRAVIMGTRSFGKGSVQTVIPVDHDSAIKITTALYYTPSGQMIQARGIIPDVSVPDLTVTSKDLSAGLTIDESDYLNHLVNGEAKKEEDHLKQLKKVREQELKLAKDDYQLYEALMMLKGLSAVKS